LFDFIQSATVKVSRIEESGALNGEHQPTALLPVSSDGRCTAGYIFTKTVRASWVVPQYRF